MIENVIEGYKVLLAFVKGHWVIIATAIAFVAGFTAWIKHVYDIAKAKLEIEKLKRELQNRETHIPIATLEEIAEFAKRNPDPKKLGKFLIKCIAASPYEEETIQLSEQQAQKYVTVLSATAEPWVIGYIFEILLAGKVEFIYLIISISVLFFLVREVIIPLFK